MITSLFARKMVAAAGAEVDQRTLIAPAGLAHDAPWDPKVMMPDTVYYDLLERIGEQTDITELPLRSSASVRTEPDTFGNYRPPKSSRQVLQRHRGRPSCHQRSPRYDRRQ